MPLFNIAVGSAKNAIINFSLIALFYYIKSIRAKKLKGSLLAI